MTLSTAEVAARFGASRPGFELVATEEVGLPFFRLTLEVVIQERASLPVIDEFVLRAVKSGLHALDDIVGVLGLDRVLVEQAVVNQSHQDNVDYRVELGAHQRTIELTTQGTNALEVATTVPERTEIDLAFDRLIWAPTGKLMTQLLKPRVARDYGLREIPPKLKKRLAVSDLDVDSIERSIRELPVKAFQDADLLSITNVSNSRHVLPAVALVFLAEDESSLQVAFAIDGRVSEAHGQAFVEIDGPERCGYVADHPPTPRERPIIPDELRSQEISRERLRELQSQRVAAEVEADSARTLTESADSVDDARALQQTGDAAAAQAADVRAEIEAAPIRPIQTYEHRELLASALSTAEQRLLIISPWLRAAVVDENFVAQLDRLCRRHVQVHIGYGIGAREERDESDESAIEALKALGRRYRNFTFKHVGNTHAKILIWDSSLVVTSFNWLSFRGDAGRRYRQEEGTFIRDPDYVEAQYESFKRQIEGPRN